MGFGNEQEKATHWRNYHVPQARKSNTPEKLSGFGSHVATTSKIVIARYQDLEPKSKIKQHTGDSTRIGIPHPRSKSLEKVPHGLLMMMMQSMSQKSF